MKSILLSIKPKYAELIASGKKTIEVRKTAPKEVPFKAYIYCSYGDMKTNYYLGGRGKVVGEFICNKVYMSFVGYMKNEPCYWDILDGSCLTKDEMMNYGKWKTLYGLHISDLKIYDKPKSIMTFYKPCPIKLGFKNCPCCEFYSTDTGFCMNQIDRPPQSWCYVEEV